MTLANNGAADSAKKDGTMALEPKTNAYRAAMRAADECDKLAAELTAKLAQLRKDSAMTPRHWTHEGDFKHIAYELRCLLGREG